MDRFRTILFAFLLLSAGCGSGSNVFRITGQTMGTTYNIVVVDRNNLIDEQNLRVAVEETLIEVNAVFSNWDKKSEVSRFNALETTKPIEISKEFADIISLSERIHTSSDGAFDITLGPLVELWGFGAQKRKVSLEQTERPSAEEIAVAKRLVGHNRLLQLSEDGKTLRKSDPRTSVYLAAIAKGHGIDRVAYALSNLGLNDYMVEIGGDLIAKGVNPEGKPWRIGIERPDASQGTVQQVIEVSGHGMATSGDYRNYYEKNGRRYTHIIDGVTGEPIRHLTASVTVLGETAAKADAWATALLVLGEARGLAIAENQDIAALFITRSQSADRQSNETQSNKSTGSAIQFKLTSSTEFDKIQQGMAVDHETIAH
ncbi:MAG: FAD:protein FMN transferase [Pseudomonadota bacterium]